VQALQLADRESPLAALGSRARATGTTQDCQTLSFAQGKVIAHQLQSRDLAVPVLEKPRQFLGRLAQDWHRDAVEKPAVSWMASTMLALVGHGNLMQQ
jgi:hypothetical protein